MRDIQKRYSLRKYRGIGLASVAIATLFLALSGQGVAADVHTGTGGPQETTVLALPLPPKSDEFEEQTVPKEEEGIVAELGREATGTVHQVTEQEASEPVLEGETVPETGTSTAEELAIRVRAATGAFASGETGAVEESAERLTEVTAELKGRHGEGVTYADLTTEEQGRYQAAIYNEYANHLVETIFPNLTLAKVYRDVPTAEATPLFTQYAREERAKRGNPTGTDPKNLEALEAARQRVIETYNQTLFREPTVDAHAKQAPDQAKLLIDTVLTDQSLNQVSQSSRQLFAGLYLLHSQYQFEEDLPSKIVSQDPEVTDEAVRPRGNAFQNLVSVGAYVANQNLIRNKNDLGNLLGRNKELFTSQIRPLIGLAAQKDLVERLARAKGQSSSDYFLRQTEATVQLSDLVDPEAIVPWLADETRLLVPLLSQGKGALVGVTRDSVVVGLNAAYRQPGELPNLESSHEAGQPQTPVAGVVSILNELENFNSFLRDASRYGQDTSPDKAKPMVVNDSLIVGQLANGQDSRVWQTKANNDTVRNLLAPLGMDSPSHRISSLIEGEQRTETSFAALNIKLLSQDRRGIGLYSHEMTHANDERLLFDGSYQGTRLTPAVRANRRQGQGPEVYARGLFEARDNTQTPTSIVRPVFNLNTSYTIANGRADQSVDQIQPSEALNSVDKLANYQHKLIKLLMWMEAKEAEVALQLPASDRQLYFNQVEQVARTKADDDKTSTNDQFVRAKAVPNSLADLVEGSYVTAGFAIDGSNRLGLVPTNGYNFLPLLDSFYGANYSQTGNTVGDLSFKRNAHEILGWYGYEAMVDYISGRSASDRDFLNLLSQRQAAKASTLEGKVEASPQATKIRQYEELLKLDLNAVPESIKAIYTPETLTRAIQADLAVLKSGANEQVIYNNLTNVRKLKQTLLSELIETTDVMTSDPSKQVLGEKTYDVIYVSNSGRGDGEEPDRPMGDLKAALAKVREGGRIVLVGDMTERTAVSIDKAVTIEAQTPDTALLLNQDLTITKPATIKGLTLQLNKESQATGLIRATADVTLDGVSTKISDRQESQRPALVLEGDRPVQVRVLNNRDTKLDSIRVASPATIELDAGVTVRGALEATMAQPVSVTSRSNFVSQFSGEGLSVTLEGANLGQAVLTRIKDLTLTKGTRVGLADEAPSQVIGLLNLAEGTQLNASNQSLSVTTLDGIGTLTFNEEATFRAENSRAATEIEVVHRTRAYTDGKTYVTIPHRQVEPSVILIQRGQALQADQAGRFTYTAPYEVYHFFESAHDGRFLPESVEALLEHYKDNAGETANQRLTQPPGQPALPSPNRLADGEGYWEFDRWKENILGDSQKIYEYRGFWRYVPKPAATYTATYQFATADGTSQTLPAALTARLLGKNQTGLEDGSQVDVTGIDTTTYTDTVNKGTWTFQGWDPYSSTISGQDVTVVGRWSFAATPTYTATYQFVAKAGTSQTLPAALTARLSGKNQTGLEDGSQVDVTGIDLTDYTDTVNKGTWTFQGWDEKTKTVSGSNVTFVGTWTFTATPTYTATYQFVAAEGTSQTLPSALTDRLSGKNQSGLGDGSQVDVTGIDTTTYTDTVNKGTWTFQGWDEKTKTVSGSNVTFVGTWVFTATPTYTANYQFVTADGTSPTLPVSLTARLSGKNQTGLEDGSQVGVTGIDTTAYTDNANKGTWTFQGWDKPTATVSGSNVTFVGRWSFTANPTYTATYQFVTSEGTSPTLPVSLTARLSGKNQTGLEDGSQVGVTGIDTTAYADTVNKGTWTFQGWDKDTATVSGSNVTFVGTWVFTATPTYTATYQFVTADGTSPTLPVSLTARLSGKNQTGLEDGSQVGVTGIDTTAYTDTVNKGTWTFQGWDNPTATVSGSNVTFVGRWSFTANPTYTATYQFVVADGTSPTLPSDLTARLSGKNQTGLEDGSQVGVTGIDTTAYTDTVNKGTWTFQGWDPYSSTISGQDVTVVGRWSFTAIPTYTATYQFVTADGTSQTLPSALTARLSGKNQTGLEDGSQVGVTGIDTTAYTDTVNKGTWTFQGWDNPTATVSGSNVTFVGRWSFTATPTYTATYQFVAVDGTSQPLPAGLTARLSGKNQTGLEDGSQVGVTGIDTTAYTDTVNKGTWIFQGWDKPTATVSGSNVTFVGRWSFTSTPTYTATYQFVTVDGTSQPLPAGLTARLSDKNQTGLEDGSQVGVTGIDTTTYTDTVNKGTWTFQGWDKPTATVSGSNVTFVGRWSFTATPTYTATYQFVAVDGTSQPLPAGLTARLSSKNQTDLEDGSQVGVTGIDTTAYTDTANKGTWTFQGWDNPTATVSGSNVTVVGRWSFMAKPWTVSYAFVFEGEAEAQFDRTAVALPAPHQVTDLSQLALPKPYTSLVTSRNQAGEWQFQGWGRPTETGADQAVKVEGRWLYKAYEAIPAGMSYQANPEAAVGTTNQVVTEGRDGKRSAFTQQEVLPPVARVELVGTKPTVERVETATQILYEADDSLEVGSTDVLKQAGQAGVSVKTTTYRVENGKAVPNEPTLVTESGQPTIYKVGTKPTVVTEKTDLPVVYKSDNQLDVGQPNRVETVGQPAVVTTTTTYRIENGQVLANTPIVKRNEGVAQVEFVGTKPTVERVETATQILYEADDSLEVGSTDVLKQAGQAGVSIKNTTYRVENGKAVPNESTLVTESGQPTIYKVGTKPTVVTEKTDLPVVYKSDDQLEVGQPNRIETAGQPTVITTTTTYRIEDGKAVANTPTVSRIEGVAQVELVGTKPTVERVETATQILYEADDSLEVGSANVLKQAGQPGVSIKTITYRIENGKAVPNEPTLVTESGQPTIYKVGTKPIVVTEKTDLPVVYKSDDQLDVGQPNRVETVGQPAVITTTTTYRIEDGKAVANTPTVSRIEGVAQVELVGTKPTVERVETPTPILYEADDRSEVGSANVLKQAGQPGVSIKTTTYRIENGKAIPNEPTLVTESGQPTIYKVGTKPIVVTEKTDLPVVYKSDDQLDVGQPNRVETVGQPAVITTTTTYRIEDGKAVANTPTVSRIEGVAQVELVGTKPTVERVETPTPILYEADDRSEVGSANVLKQAGQPGVSIKTITYRIENGKAVPNEPTLVTESGQPTIYKVGTKPTVVTEKTDLPVVYKSDNQLDVGQPNRVETVGQSAVVTTTTTYRIENGQVLANTPIVKRTEGVAQVEFVGTKPTVERVETATQILYEADDNLEVGSANVLKQAGQAGVSVKTTTYRVENGTAVPNEPTLVTESGQPTIYKVGTKPTVVTEKTALPVVYKSDDQLEVGQPNRVETVGQPMVVTTTTTYRLENGQALANTPTVSRIEGVAQVEFVGTKPMVVTEEVMLPIIYEEEPSLVSGSLFIKRPGLPTVTITTVTYRLENGKAVANPPQVTTILGQPEIQLVGIKQEQNGGSDTVEPLPTFDPSADSDGDGFSNGDELTAGSDPKDANSQPPKNLGMGLTTPPLPFFDPAADSDEDGFSNSDELTAGSDPKDANSQPPKNLGMGLTTPPLPFFDPAADSDEDGFSNSDELTAGSDPKDANSQPPKNLGMGLTTPPLPFFDPAADSDGDGFSNGDELTAGSDPKDANSPSHHPSQPMLAAQNKSGLQPNQTIPVLPTTKKQSHLPETGDTFPLIGLGLLCLSAGVVGLSGRQDKEVGTTC